MMSRFRRRLSRASVAPQRSGLSTKSLISLAPQRRASASPQRVSAIGKILYSPAFPRASARLRHTPLLRRGGRGPEPPPLPLDLHQDDQSKGCSMTPTNQPAGQVDDADAVAAYLVANPGKTERDFKDHAL